MTIRKKITDVWCDKHMEGRFPLQQVPPAGAGWGVNLDEVLGVTNSLFLQESHSYGVRPQYLSYSNLQKFIDCVARKIVLGKCAKNV